MDAPHDYLPRICAPAVVDDVFTHGRKVFEVDADPTDVPTMPIEFSVAAFRLGHTMIRRAYNWNRVFADGQGTLEFLFTFSGRSGDLGGKPRLPSNWIADFRRLYDFAEAGRADLTVPAAKSNRAMRIDTQLVDPLRRRCRPFGGPAVAATTRQPGVPQPDPRQDGPAGDRAADGDVPQEQGRTLNALTKAQIPTGRAAPTLSGLTTAQRTAFVKDTPLWFYILREAELNTAS